MNTLALVAAVAAAGVVAVMGRAPMQRLAPPREARAAPAWLRGVPGSPSVFLRAAVAVCCGCAVTLLLGWWSESAAWVGVAVAAGVFGAGLRPGSDRRRRTLAVARDLPQLCTLMAVCLEAGLPLRAAVTAVGRGLGGPLGEAMRRLDAQVRLGIPEAEAWRAMSDEQGLEVLGREVARATGSGVALARVLRSQAGESRRDLHARAEIEAKKVGVRSVVPLMVCVLPAFVLVGVIPIIGGVISRFFG
jgi:pilus assembly protein TadC